MAEATERQPLAMPTHTSTGTLLRRRLRFLRWIVPAGLLLIVIGYEVGPSIWIQSWFGPQYHTLAEILIYGTVGPIVAFVLLDFLDRWLEERETSDLQARLLTRARKQTAASRQMADKALQELFAASIHLAQLEAGLVEAPAQATEQMKELRAILDQSIQEIRAHLLATGSDT